ncbi:outer membrane lipoprotein-sorting protein [Prosthecochloris sp. SCSIO W1101]|uniref:outer membrane lipoprotein-sorting protein n=1 Tax=Prosthecochloris sp. SCSIO W1101 TaxID=2992242 RepID=UPI00223DB0F5|nr:outer membrane lipoprotein-sorting protein [Prosthecochloris sp. SCSIO W1101]UZJ41265.1 outer membrane lipoprotein-sorting protein [Prosthecochloris sp. SCSIO W1101]
MYNVPVAIILSIAIGLFSRTCRAETDTVKEAIDPKASEILQRADSARSPWPDFTMAADIAFEKHGQLKKEKFRVFVKDYLKSLVSYVEPVKQRGNMLLMVGDNLWYYVNNTRRPMRITPIQKLSGGASYGDITRLSWSKDYSPEPGGEQSVAVGERSFDTWFLKLKANSKSATYHTIDLYVEKGTFFPRKAVVYLQSGKKMKTMYFTEYKTMAGKKMNTRIEFIDHLSSDNMTSLTFSNVIVKTSPNRFFLKSSLSTLYGEVVY